jgi:hypothetical protein
MVSLSFSAGYYFLKLTCRTSASDISIFLFLFLFLCAYAFGNDLICLQRQHIPGVSCLGIESIHVLGWIWFSVWGWIPVCFGSFFFFFICAICYFSMTHLEFIWSFICILFSPFFHFSLPYDLYYYSIRSPTAPCRM